MKTKIRTYLICLLAVFCTITLECMPVHAAKLPSLNGKGTQLVNAKGKTVRLKGVSTHGLSWYPEYVNQKAFTYMKKNWKINAVRLALYTSEYNGYCTGDAANRKAARELAGLLPDAKVREIPGAGHEVNRDAPGELAAAIRKFCADTMDSGK